MKKPLISVVTVVRNRENVVERCIKSVLGQTFKDYEFLIKDGNSTDKTVEIVAKYNKQLTYFETSPDKSLYDAMNIATTHATGEWVCYIQSDDQLIDNKVLENVAPYLEKTKADVVYGTAIMQFDWDVTRTLKAYPIETVWQHMPFCHQAMFVRADLAKKFPYDLAFKSAADYDLVYKLYYLGFRFDVMPVTVAKLSAGGLSDAKRIAGLREVGVIKKQYDKNPMHHLLHSLYILKSDVRLRIRNMLPTSIVKRIFKLRENLTEK